MFLENIGTHSFSSLSNKKIFIIVEEIHGDEFPMILEQIPTQSESIAIEWLFLKIDFRMYLQAMTFI